MKKIALVLSAIALMLASCGDGTLSVSEYNQKATALYNPLDARYSQLGDKLLSDGNTPADDAATLSAVTKSTDSVRMELGKLKPCKDAQAMHQSLLAVVDFEKTRILPAMNKVMLLRDKPEELGKMVNELNTLQTETQKLVDKMTTEQQAMAAKAGTSLH